MPVDQAMAGGFTQRMLADDAATAALGHELSLFVSAGDWICLEGDLGAGKTALARALINGLAGAGAHIEVPSPTFTLIQLYADTRVPVAHCDFYRLGDAREADELGLDELRETHLVVTEWPDRLGAEIPADRIVVSLLFAGSGRRAEIRGLGKSAAKVDRMAAVADFLDSYCDGRNVERRFFQGDASSRRYEKLTFSDGRVELLMDMPDVPDGPPVRDGKPYSAIAHLATGIRAVIAVNGELRKAGYAAPDTFAMDLAQGLAVIEHLDGAVYGKMMRAGADMAGPMGAAVEVLADMAGRNWPEKVALPDGSTYLVAPFDLSAFMIETALLVDWFWPSLKGQAVPDTVRTRFRAIWEQLYALTQDGPAMWMLRDFHSPNLIWMPQRTGVQRVGLIDTQDAVLGHPAYDLVSMLQDAREDVSRETEARLLAHYCSLRRTAEPGFDEQAFRTAYAVLGAQRASKILGIFIRLNERDGKPYYLRHIPRVSGYLERNLAHPALGELKAWYDEHLPHEVRQDMGSA